MCATSPEEDEDEIGDNDVDVDAVDGNGMSVVPSENNFSVALSILSKSTKAGYECISHEVMGEFGISHDVLPSYHVLTKDRANITELTITPNASRFGDIDAALDTVDRIILDHTDVNKIRM